MKAMRIYQCTAWCSEIGSLRSLNAPELHASGDAREPISLHQAVCITALTVWKFLAYESSWNVRVWNVYAYEKFCDYSGWSDINPLSTGQSKIGRRQPISLDYHCVNISQRIFINKVSLERFFRYLNADTLFLKIGQEMTPLQAVWSDPTDRFRARLIDELDLRPRLRSLHYYGNLKRLENVYSK